MHEYQATIESDMLGFTQRNLMWRRRQDGALDIMTMTEHGLMGRTVTPKDGEQVVAKPFIEFATPLWPEIDGVLKALHDLYRRTHNLDDGLASKSTVQALNEALSVERARVDHALSSLLAGGQ